MARGVGGIVDETCKVGDRSLVVKGNVHGEGSTRSMKKSRKLGSGGRGMRYADDVVKRNAQLISKFRIRVSVRGMRETLGKMVAVVFDIRKAKGPGIGMGAGHNRVVSGGVMVVMSNSGTRCLNVICATLKVRRRISACKRRVGRMFILTM